MTKTKEQNYIETLLQINSALTTGLESTIVFLENYEKTTEEQRNKFIDQIKSLVNTSRDAFGPKQVH